MLKKKSKHEELEQTQYEEIKASKTFIETVLNSLTDSLYVIRTADLTVLGANNALPNQNDWKKICVNTLNYWNI